MDKIVKRLRKIIDEVMIDEKGLIRIQKNYWKERVTWYI